MIHSPLAEMIGNYIFEQRKRQSMTQNELAKNLGFSPQFMGRIEKGEVMIPEHALVNSIELLDLAETRLKKIYRQAWQSDFNSLMSKVGKSGPKKRASRR